MKYFKECKTRQQLKDQFRNLAMQHHPDKNPNDPTATATMQEIIKEYEEMILRTYDDTSKAPHFDHKNDLSFVDIINKIFSIYKDASIEITGLFLWIDSDEKTRQYKDQLKEFMRWGSEKKKWYYTPLPKTRSRVKVSMNEIRKKYGSYTVQNDQNQNTSEEFKQVS